VRQCRRTPNIPPVKQPPNAIETHAAPHVPVIAAACRVLDASESPPDMTALAGTAGMSVSHFHRLFKTHTGLTPRAYAAAARAERLRHVLPLRSSVTDAIYEAGFNSSGRFYEASHQMLGMAPARYRRGGEGETIRFAVGQCSLGAILAASTETGVCAILMGDDPGPLVVDLQKRFPAATLIGADAGYESTVAAVIGLVEQPQLGAALPLDIRGTAFQRRVWKALTMIPSGAVVTYADIARGIGSPAAVRAVAGACAANPLAIAIPCHRVVRSDGALSGYRWGVDRKRELLRRESAGIES
jgi:AraC family transcriptional regulator of adaptative response/methylated-DNA-[protein]-cysteine methyltransferase